MMETVEISGNVGFQLNIDTAGHLGRFYFDTVSGMI
jgi:hypothetical protein